MAAIGLCTNAAMIITAGASRIGVAVESQVLHRLSHILKPIPRDDDSGSEFSLKILDEFEIQGPNGNHRCIVTEPLGPSLYSVFDVLGGGRLPLDIGRKIAVQVAKGLSYLHTRGVHGDLHLGNILLRIPGLDLWSPRKSTSISETPKRSKSGDSTGKNLPLHLLRRYQTTWSALHLHTNSYRFA
ncbi:hypothetical protein Q9L58_004333 [Maublancomyces gigas]|uniref:non-specific serine/threonine protein kinase n=1 Tax=Discina gigas TaxID=1032678 RepID=A0ABR3GLC5_9PEZI